MENTDDAARDDVRLSGADISDDEGERLEKHLGASDGSGESRHDG